MSTSTGRTGRTEPSSWALGASVFAGIVMATIGVLQFFEGLVGIIDGNKFLVKTPNYVFELNVTAWGWVHLILGAVMALTGCFILTGNIVARTVGAMIAGLSAVLNFIWLPHYPVWAILIIAIDVVVIWALTTGRADPLDG